MLKYTTGLMAVTALTGVFAALFYTKPISAQARPTSAVYTPEGKLMLPNGYRKWVFIGAPLTPHGLNGGKASFPEFHHVYVEAHNLEAYQKSGQFPEGTVIVKELTLVKDATFPDGSRTEPSGCGFFDGEFNGMDVTVKDSKRFSKTNGWGFFNFGHHPLPYETAVAEAPKSECAGCHMENVAKTDMTWVQFYPVLQGQN